MTNCKQCGDTGLTVYADAENGPEFDSEGLCECEAGERLMMEVGAQCQEEAEPLPPLSAAERGAASRALIALDLAREAEFDTRDDVEKEIDAHEDDCEGCDLCG